MADSVQHQLDYQSVDAVRGRRRIRRWVMIVAAALGLTYMILLVFTVATDDYPARAARSHARESAYAFLITGLSIAAYFTLDRRNASRTRPTSFLAFFSALIAVLNPACVDFLNRIMGIPGISRGDSELRSFAVGFASMVVGIIAAARIRRSRGLMSGMWLAIVGMGVGALWVIFWIGFVLIFAIGMAGFR